MNEDELKELSENLKRKRQEDLLPFANRIDELKKTAKVQNRRKEAAIQFIFDSINDGSISVEEVEAWLRNVPDAKQRGRPKKSASDAGPSTSVAEVGPSTSADRPKRDIVEVDYQEDTEGNKVAFVPVGQYHVTDIEKWNKDKKIVKDNPHNWPKGILSYEAWIAMTGYDETETGGVKFQQLMHYLLTEGSLRDMSNLELSKHYFEKQTRVGTNWKAGVDQYKIPESDFAYHSSETQAKYKIAGGHTGDNQKKHPGFAFDEKRYLENIAAVQPGSALNWLQAMSLQHKNVPSANWVATQHVFATNGFTPRDNSELDGYMAVANRIAAIYGLYYYPGCGSPLNNWSVRHDLGESLPSYDIRMRMWNPNYTLEDGYLRVNEKLNPEAAGVESGLLGDGNFYVDTVEDVSTSTVSGGKGKQTTFSIVRDSEHKTMIAPFYLRDSTTKEMNVMKACRKLAFHFDMPMMHKPSNVFFGFNIPKALWLYPHHYSSTERLTTLTSKSTESAKPIGQLYQRWPTMISTTYNPVNHHWTYLDDHVKDQSLIAMRQKVLDLDMGTFRQGVSSVSAVGTSVGVDYSGVHATGEGTDGAVSRFESVNDEDVDDTVNLVDVEYVSDTEIGDTNTEGNMAHVDEQYDKTTEKGISKTEFINAAGGDGRRGVVALSEGADRRDMDSVYKKDGGKFVKVDDVCNFNRHFSSIEAQPWPHQDCYTVASVEPIVGEEMNEAEVKEYVNRFGSKKNLFLRSSTLPRTIKGFETQYGYAMDVMDTTLDEDTPMHRKHMCKILAIYFDNCPLGTKGAQSIPVNSKQSGMVNGVYARRCIQTGIPINVRYDKPDHSERNDWILLWPAVFKKAPEPSMAVHFDINLFAGEIGDAACNVKVLKDYVAKVKSGMKVHQWVTTPWHLGYLPYRQQHSLFRDGETFSEGCTRCSRPFFEYKHRYSQYVGSSEGTKHWPTLLWHGRFTAGLAPSPIHDERFWSEEQVKALPDAPDPDPKILKHCGPGEELCGYNNWETREFLLKPSNMGYEHTKRKDELKNIKEPFTFKRYDNYVYDDARVSEFWSELTGQRDYPKIVQGYVGSKGKVKYGHREYCLARESFYTNTCKDCAARLELAPGLYIRNHKIVTSTGLIVGSKKHQKNKLTEWANLIGRRIRVNEPAFNIEHMHGRSKPTDSRERERYEREFTQSMEIYARYVRELQDKAPLGKSTKFHNTPTIYIQKQVDGFDDTNPKKDWQQIDAAIKGIKALMEDISQPTSASGALRRYASVQLLLANTAFRDMLWEIERKYSHRASYVPERTTGKYDSKMKRLEYRNVSKTLDGVEYENCLRVDEFKVQSKSMPGGSTIPAQMEVDTKVYYAHRTDSNGSVITPPDKPTMWCGDGYVTGWDNANKKWNVESRGTAAVRAHPRQWRGLRQSRFFITYTLHRAVTSEVEARHVLEKIADACYTLFGDDQHLSDMLIFGYKLGGYEKWEKRRGASIYPNPNRSDTISAAKFEIIGETNKDADLPTFYGQMGASSYIYDTYQTHVHRVDVDGGIEIGPNLKHPHFHILLTVEHWSYVHFDYFKMNSYLEMMLRGIDALGKGWGDTYKIYNASGKEFYGDNEKPFVDIKMYPQDNWNDIISAYVRKNHVPGIFEAVGARTGMS